MQAWKQRFFSHKVGDGARDAMGLVRGHIMGAAEIVQERVPEGREKSLAMTKLEEAMFWANAGVSRMSEDSELDDESAFVLVRPKGGPDEYSRVTADMHPPEKRSILDPRLEQQLKDSGHIKD